MRTPPGRHRALAVLCAAVLAGSALAGCGSDDDKGGDSGSPDAPGQITLTVGLFGSFGYEEAGLYKEYEALHPNIKIKQNATQKEEVYWPALQTRLGGGGDLDDIQGIEVGRIVDVVNNQADKWLDLNTLGAQTQTQEYLSWKAKAATTADGKSLALGTDVGPMAICYRSDLFQQAGLPTGRDELAQKWSTWEGYLDVGRQFAAKAPKGSSYMDSVTGMYNAMIGQQQTFYYDASGKLIYDTNPAVRSAFDLSAKAAQDGLSAKLVQFQTDWDQAFAKGGFATISCPSWMIGYIKEKAGDATKGKWDVAAAPGATGNWGGSYLAIPKGAKHAKEAYELLQWLTAKEQQVKLFERRGSFPSRTTAISQVAATTDPYFNGAPIGQIFSQAAQKMPVQTLGVRDNDVKVAIQNALNAVEAQGVKPDDAWKDAKASVKAALG
ncbi:ABC transporter substrate-binding protein [Yinghuangia soli]|uniref:Extracellular solute-binding protein n=1 Tax=Yinghuangia soli TaxID=2908204 RepID=A0AA41PUW1_9ACTN|nr:extracellular solute-binding protein [Yinghuangia soli]MCF2526188.1 extracellular solute-binding protein [Yinghuangia soli]